MKLQSIIESTKIKESDDPAPQQDIVDKFAGVSDKLRSYYIMKWAEEKGMSSDKAMCLAGYVRDGYMGAGAWNWRYVGMNESIQEGGENMIGQPDDFYDAEERTKAYNELQDTLQGNYMDDYIKDGDCPACGGSGYMDGEETFTNDDGEEEESSECDGFGNYGCDEGEMTYGSDGPSWVEIIKHDKQQAERQQAKDNYPGDEAVIDFAASTANQLKKSGQDPRDTLEYVRKEYPSMGRRQRADLVAKGMKKAGLTSEGKSPHKKGTAKHKKHMAAMHAGMGEGMNEELQIQKIRNSKGEIIQYTILNGEPFDVNGAPLEYGQYWDIMTADGHSDIEINSNMWPAYEKRNAGVKGYESIQAGDELMIESEDGAGIIVPVLHVVEDNVLIGWDATADSLFEETEEIEEGERHGNSKIYNKCWKGYSKVPGKSAGEKGSCKKNEDIERIRHLAGIDEGSLEMYAKPDEVKKAVEHITKRGFPMSGKFVNWCKENNCTFSMDFNDPKNLQKAAIAKINFEKDTGYGTDGTKLSPKPPKQGQLPFSPRDPEQKEFDFEEGLDEAEYQGRKVKLGKPTRGDVKKFKVYVKDPKTGNIKKVNFGHGGSSAKKAGQKTMKIRKSNPKARKSFRARHNCDNPGPRTKARYWSCRKW